MDRRPTSVLLVDDEAPTLDRLGALLEHQGFRVTLSRSAREAVRLLDERVFDAIVTDVVFEGRDDGSALLSAASTKCPQTAVLLMTGYPAVDRAVAAIKDGAYDYLQKPIDPIVLGAKVTSAVRERQLDTEALEFRELVEILSHVVAHTIELVDPYTAGHGERTRKYVDLLARDLSIDATTRERLELAAVAHDYGKIYLDDLGFLTKKGKLTDAEYKKVQAHPSLGAEKLGRHPRLEDVCTWIEEHHERWDGKGYPHQKAAEAISLPGRILGVVEVFDSLATKRSYKDAWSLEKVMGYFEFQKAKAFDPEVVDAFLKRLEVHGAEWIAAPQQDGALQRAAGAARLPQA